MVFCGVAPKARGTGVGHALLKAQVDLARQLGRTQLLTFTALDGHPARFLAANGFEVGMRTAQRRLHPQQLDYAHIAELAAEAAERARDYELVHLEGPASEEMLPSLVSLHEAINDAPMDDITLEPDVFPVERVRRYDLAMQKRRQQVYRLMARHRRTGEWAGHTILCVDGTRPGYAVQEDTSVVRDHRGHRLGMVLKASMLLWMREAHPELTTIDTWNATSNTHMIAVNEALGCEVSQLGVAMQRTL
jgi:GNAT superfamily N-acetyltransferase